MTRIFSVIAIVLGIGCLVGCASQQSRYSPIGQSYESLPSDYAIEVFRADLPRKKFMRVARLDVHIEKTHFLSSDLEEALPELIEQARLSGSHAIVEIDERRSTILETKVYHVTAVGIRYVSEE